MIFCKTPKLQGNSDCNKIRSYSKFTPDLLQSVIDEPMNKFNKKIEIYVAYVYCKIEIESIIYPLWISVNRVRTFFIILLKANGLSSTSNLLEYVTRKYYAFTVYEHP